MEDKFSEFKSSLIKVPSAMESVIVSKTDWKMSLINFALLPIVAVAFIKFIVLIRERLRKHKIFDIGKIPSVGKKNPFTGNLPKVRFDNKTLGRYHGKMGKSFGFFYGPDPVVVTFDRELLHKLVIVEGNKHVDALQLRTPFVEFNRSIIQLGGNEWRQVRRILTPSFAHRQIKTDSVVQDIESVCTKLLTCIMGYPLESDGRIIDVQNIFSKFALATILRVAYGREDAVDMDPGRKDEFVESIHMASRKIKNSALILPIMFHSLSRPLRYLIQFTQLGQVIKLIHSTISGCLEDRRRMLKRGEKEIISNESLPAQKMIDILIELSDNNKMDDVSLKANMFMILLAGFDTTSNALTSMFWLLARHPNIQEKLRQAIKNEGGEQAIYLDWCIRETLRLFPPVPFAGRVVNEDITTPQGQTIFKGTSIMVNIYSLHHCAEYWGPDVEEFRPERFSEPLENSIQYFPFGGGPRGCLGKNLAKAEIRAIVTRILLKFKVETCVSTPDEIVWSGTNLIHTTIKGPISLRFVELSCLSNV